MAKKAAHTATSTGGPKIGGTSPAKATAALPPELDKPNRNSIMVAYLKDHPDATWKTAEDHIHTLMKGAGVPIKDDDGGAFSNAKTQLKKKMGQGTIAKGSTVGMSTTATLKQFAEAAKSKNIDPNVVLEIAELIRDVGGVSNAVVLSAKYRELVDAIGEENAKKAIEVL